MSIYLSLVIFIVASIAVYFLVPREKISRYFLFGLVAGPVIGWVLNYLFINYFGYWNFGPLDFLYWAGVPLFQVLIWWPLEIAYGYYFEEARTSLTILSLILLLPALATLAHYAYLILGLLEYNNWYLLNTFLLALIIQVGYSAYLYYSVRERNRLS